MKPDWRAFTIKHTGRINVLKSSSWLRPTALIANGEITELTQYEAIWDTGASGTVITEKVASDLKLKAIGKIQCFGVHGSELRDQYLIDIGLPNSVLVQNLMVTSADKIPGCDVLIGMDIIAAGDFSVCNEAGQTSFSFRIPSGDRIDFVQQHADEMNRFLLGKAQNDNTPGGPSQRKSSRRNRKK